MRNWTVDIEKLKKYPAKYKKWQTEQLLNFGMDEGDYLDKNYIKEHIDELEIEEDTRAYLKFALQDGN